MRGLCFSIGLSTLLASAAVAQNDSSGTDPVASTAAGACRYGPISYVFIDNHNIFDERTEDEGRFTWAYRVVNGLHMRTRRSVIARELLFGPGDCFEPIMLEESERLLRSYGFLSQVDIFGVPQPDGTYHVIVNTRDDWSTQLDVRVTMKSGVDFEGMRIREANFLGRGQTLGAYYISRDVTRDYGVVYETPQLGGTRWDLRTALGATRAGTLFAETVAYPFVGDVSRWAASQGFSREDRYFDYVAEAKDNDINHVLVPLRDKHFDLALVTRVGHPGSLTFLGGALTYEELTYPGEPRLADDDDIRDVSAADSILLQPALAKRDPLNSIRLGVLLGHRNITWVKRRGLDSMRGEQDVGLGAEVGLSAGRSLRALAPDDDMAGTLSFYSAAEFTSLLIAGRARLDARRDFAAGPDVPEWQDVYGDAEVLAYIRPSWLARHTLVLRGIATAGWNTRTPFQLTLGGDRGLRGYRDNRFPGGRRIVLTAEERMFWGWPRPDILDLGSTVFVDVGRILPGDVPYGEDSGWRATAGFGLRASFPAGSRTTYRFDVAVPVRPGTNAGDVRLILSVGELIGLSTIFGDRQLERSRHERMAAELLRLNR